MFTCGQKNPQQKWKRRRTEKIPDRQKERKQESNSQVKIDKIEKMNEWEMFENTCYFC